MMALKSTHYRKLQNPAVAFSAISVSLFLLVAVYFLDPANHRWLRLADRWACSLRNWPSRRW